MDEATNDNPRVLRTGDTAVLWKDNRDPLGAFMTKMAIAAFTCGFDILTKKSFCHIARELPPAEPGGEPRVAHAVSWLWNPEPVTFAPIEREEQITVAEFQQRFEDWKWIEKNLDHPIAYLRIMIDKAEKVARILRDHGPAIFVEDASGAAAIGPADTPAEVFQEMFDELKKHPGK